MHDHADLGWFGVGNFGLGPHTILVYRRYSSQLHIGDHRYLGIRKIGIGRLHIGIHRHHMFSKGFWPGKYFIQVKGKLLLAIVKFDS